MQNDYTSTIKFLEKMEELSIPIIISDFSLYSICIVLSDRKEKEGLLRFVNYFKNPNNSRIYRADIREMKEIIDLKLNLDFDDKLHYYLAKKKNLTFISYDKDFDKTDLKRQTPAEALKNFTF